MCPRDREQRGLDPLQIASGAADQFAAKRAQRGMRPTGRDAQRGERSERDGVPERRQYPVAELQRDALVREDVGGAHEGRSADEERPAHRKEREAIAALRPHRRDRVERQPPRARAAECRRDVPIEDCHVRPEDLRHSAPTLWPSGADGRPARHSDARGAARQTQDRMALMLGAMRWLFATDGSRGAGIALDFLSALPLAGADHVTVLTVPTYSFVGTPALERGQADLLVDRGAGPAYAVAARALERFSARGVPATVDVRAGPVTEAIEVAAFEYAAEVIVIGSRGLGAFAGSILGSVARALAHHASVPVLVVRECRTGPRRIIVAVDGSDDARAAIALLAHMPLASDAGITLVHVLEDGADERPAEMVLAQAARTLVVHAIDHAVIERGHVAEQILARAALAKTDLIVLGSRGQTRAAGFLQGSVADQVLSQAHCAVLVAKAALKPSVVAEPWLAMPRAAVAL